MNLTVGIAPVVSTLLGLWWVVGRLVGLRKPGRNEAETLALGEYFLSMAGSLLIYAAIASWLLPTGTRLTLFAFWNLAVISCGLGLFMWEWILSLNSLRPPITNRSWMMFKKNGRPKSLVLCLLALAFAFGPSFFLFGRTIEVPSDTNRVVWVPVMVGYSEHAHGVFWIMSGMGLFVYIFLVTAFRLLRSLVAEN